MFFEKQDKKIKEEEKKDISLKSPERRISENEVKEQILIKPPGKEVSKKENAGEHSKMRDSSQNEDLNRTSPLSQKEKENLVKKVEGCSTRATQKLLSEVDPSLSPLKKEKVRFLGKGKVEVKIVIDEKCHKELEKLKNLLSHRNPNLSYGELISILSKEALKKHDPGEKNIRQRKEAKVQKNPSVKKPEFKSKSVELAVTSAPKSEQINQYSKEKATFALRTRHQIKKISRYIPSHLRKYIWERDGGQCTYVHHETKRRCACRHLLQIDHIQPFALGGRTEKENLRLLCAGHNQYRR